MLGKTSLLLTNWLLLPVTRRFIYLEEGDIVEITRRHVHIFSDVNGEEVNRDIIESNVQYDAGDKGIYRHYMQKRSTNSL